MMTRDWLTIVSAAIAALTSFLLAEPGSRFSRHREAKIRTLAEQAGTAELHPAVRETLLAQAHDLIAWEAARRKYTPQVSFWPTYLLFVVTAIGYAVVSLTGLMSTPSLAITWVMSLALIISAGRLLRVVLRTEPETARIHLCKATNTGDIESLEPLFPLRAVAINACKLHRYRNSEIDAPAACVILRRAHLRQLRNDGIDPATMQLIELSLPTLSDFARWTAMAPAIGTHNINAAIREWAR